MWAESSPAKYLLRLVVKEYSQVQEVNNTYTQMELVGHLEQTLEFKDNLGTKT